MKILCNAIFLSIMGGLLSSCSSKEVSPLKSLSPDELALAKANKIDVERFTTANSQPLYKSTPREMVEYIAYLQATEPDLRKRVITIARKNIGQPYELYLLGEAPFEPYDSQPTICLDKSDCVVFVEHTYAMALSNSWESFYMMLQRIRYNDGVIGVTTRNHYTEADWNPNNAWLAKDISRELAGEQTVTYKQVVNRQGFFKNRYDLDVEIEKETIVEDYVPMSEVMNIASQLQDGDCVNFVRGKKDGSAWVGHLGLVASKPDGTKTIIHSAEPAVREQDLSEIVENSINSKDKKWAKDQQANLGFKFLRLQENPRANLVLLDGENAPNVSIGFFNNHRQNSTLQ